MKRRILVQFLIIVLFIVNILFIYKLNKSKKTINNSIKLINNQLLNISYLKKAIKENDSIELAEMINTDLRYNINSTLIANKLAEKPLLVYRYKLSSCHACVDSMLVLLKSESNRLKKNLLIISDEQTKHGLHVRLHYMGLDGVKYETIKKLSFQLDSFNRSYFFLVDNNMQSRMFFIPNMNNKNRTRRYLKFIEGKFW